MFNPNWGKIFEIMEGICTGVALAMGSAFAGICIYAAFGGQVFK